MLKVIRNISLILIWILYIQEKTLMTTKYSNKIILRDKFYIASLGTQVDSTNIKHCLCKIVFSEHMYLYNITTIHWQLSFYYSSKWNSVVSRILILKLSLRCHVTYFPNRSFYYTDTKNKYKKLNCEVKKKHV